MEIKVTIHLPKMPVSFSQRQFLGHILCTQHQQISLSAGAQVRECGLLSVPFYFSVSLTQV